MTQQSLDKKDVKDTVFGTRPLMKLLEGPVSVTVVVSNGNDVGQWILPKDLLIHVSPFFAAALKGPFIESKTNVIQLKEESPDAFRFFLHWLYVLALSKDGKYPMRPPKDIEITVATQAWALGDKLGCPRFQDFALVQALYNISNLKNKSDAVKITREVYDSTSKGAKLRQLLASMILHWSAADLTEKNTWAQLMEELDDLATDIAKLQVLSAKPFQINNLWSDFLLASSYSDYEHPLLNVSTK
ncbi:MAG: hypothetical protein Q9219_005822 [cf. Caloplaca sp. 3 TL-2023]